MYVDIDSTEDLKFAKSTRARVNTRKLCDCPNSEPGIVSIDAGDHLPGCRFWKRARSSKYGSKTSAVPDKIMGGYGVGVVLREDF